jgi:phosphoserine phosphatase
MNRLFLLDVDSTLINEEVIDVIAAYANVAQEVKEITDLAMRGEIDFKRALSMRVALLEDLPISILEKVSDQITLTTGATELISKLSSENDHVAVVSGGFFEIISPLMQRLGIHRYRANKLESLNGKLTGSTKGPIIDRVAKANYLEELKSELNPFQTIAIGDGANDIDMVLNADIGVAFCAKPVLKEVADVIIEKRDLREILKFL